MGAWTLALASCLAALGVALGWGTPVRLLLAPLFFAGFLGVFQAREHTCVALASRGLRDLDTGPQRIDDPERDRAVRSKARGVFAKSVVAALVATLIVVLVLP